MTVDPILTNEQQGHDALFDGLDFNPVKRTVSIRLQTYPAHDAAERIDVVLVFEKVATLAVNADVASLASNRFAGTVSYWHIAESKGTSHIYLAGGYIAVTHGTTPKLIRV